MSEDHVRIVLYTNNQEEGDAPDCRFRHFIYDDGKLKLTRVTDGKIKEMSVQKAQKKYPMEFINYFVDMGLPQFKN